MAKNYMKEVAALLGVELGEKFRAEGYETGPDIDYAFTKGGLTYFLDGKEYLDECALEALLIGKAEIIKKPWRPKCGERYCSWSVDIHMSKECLPYMSLIWKNSGSDIERLAMGNCFKSYKEAIVHKDAVIKLYTDILKGVKD